MIICWFCGGNCVPNKNLYNKSQDCKICCIQFYSYDSFKSISYLKFIKDGIYAYTVLEVKNKIFHPGRSSFNIGDVRFDLPDYYLCNNNPQELHDKLTKIHSMCKVFS